MTRAITFVGSTLNLDSTHQISELQFGRVKCHVCEFPMTSQ